MPPKARSAIRLLLLIAAFSIFGCTTTVAVAPAAMTAAIDELEDGDHVLVRTAAGWHERVRVVDVDATSIRAERAGDPISFARGDVLELQVRRAAPGKTAGLAVGIYLMSLYALCGNPFDEPVTC